MKLLQKSINARRKAAKKVFLRPILFLMKNKFLAEITFSIFFFFVIYFLKLNDLKKERACQKCYNEIWR